VSYTEEEERLFELLGFDFLLEYDFEYEE